MTKKKKGYYPISVVARMFDVHQQTIRLYEKEGLINPKRTPGNTRMFSQADIEKLEEIIYLTNKMGVNVAGVEMILKLQKQVKKLQDKVSKLFEEANEELAEQGKQLQDDAKAHAQKLLVMKQQSLLSDSNETDDEVADEWEVDYDE